MTMGTAGLQYLDFDFSEDEHGLGSFDAMASVLPAQVPALHAELTRVLAWACDAFSKGPLDEAYDWDYDLQLADGRWMDSRAAARAAANALEKGSTIVMR